MPSAASSDRPLRRDAERNRQRILDAARDVFAERGLDATLDDIARHAGVGVGTVYRRFPNRDALVDELFEERIAEIVALAERAAAMDDPWEGFATWLEESIAVQAADRGLKDVLLAPSEGCNRVGRARERLLPLITRIVRRGQDAGVVRDDLRTEDMPLVMTMFGAVIDVTHGLSPDAWRRCLGVVLDGCRARPGAATPLPGAPIPEAEIDTVIRAQRRR